MIVFYVGPKEQPTYEPIVMVTEKTLFGHMLNILLSVGDVYKAAGGSGIKVTMVRTLEQHLENESPYEVLNGTPFANAASEWREVYGGSLIKRSQIHHVLDVLAGAHAGGLKTDLDRRYPQGIWQDSFPLESAFEYLVNTHQEKFKTVRVEDKGFDKL